MVEHGEAAEEAAGESGEGGSAGSGPVADGSGSLGIGSLRARVA